MKIRTKIKRTIFLVRYEWTFPQLINVLYRTIITFLKLPIAVKKDNNYFFKKKYLKGKDNLMFFDFNGAKLPYVENHVTLLRSVFEDTFFIPYHFGDNYEKKIAEYVDKNTWEGPYGYTDGIFDVTVKAGMVVIDVGAWIGDFSAYAASKNAICYAFEPVQETYQWLCETKKLNEMNCQVDKILPVQEGLSDHCGKANIFLNDHNDGMHSMLTEAGNMRKEEISVITLDQFVEENKLTKVDFIKADIEGAERYMLKGASNTLKTFAPKLAICTYHLADDREVLTKIILDANPDYKIKYLRHKLFAAVV